MRFDIYKSAQKISMLFDQVPKQKLDQLAVELKIDLKVFSATASTREPDAKGLDEKLSVVLAALEREGQIGTADQPRSYFRGELPMIWGDLNLPSNAEDESSWIPRSIIFCGKTTNGTAIALVGSHRYLIGSDASQTATAFYIKPSTAFRIAAALESDIDPSDNIYLEGLIEPQWHESPVQQNLEFVAKTFLNLDGKIIGSPLYVALK
ncbi:MAG: SAVMC3_10250 family protein [Rhodospirillales bacterium]|nr:SAVMC3_10250 family protein [Rhodospirillales bacterium]MDH3967549.1 SAVMC3_10250 family protein [Rhodospirillales bacterium]